MKVLVLSLGLLFSLSSSANDKSHECRRNLADWLNSGLSSESKIEKIESFCSDFNGRTKHINSCLNSAFSWVARDASLDHKYQFSFIVCKNIRNAPTTILTGNDRIQSCLNKQWDEYSYIFNYDERRLIVAEKCSLR
jgi:hypothetical protein